MSDLLHTRVERRPATLRFDGRVLFLVDDAALMRRQLEGEDLDWSDDIAGLLRDQISTDEITPAYICYYFDETLGLFPYLGLRAGGEFPVERGSVRRGGFVCSVSGKRRGKGSSREQSPYAELMAGIRVVIAQNIERIYNENCQNLGVLTSTDFSLIQRIRARESISLAEFTAGVDPITRDIIEYGGLFEYNVARMQGQVTIPPIPSQVQRDRDNGAEGGGGDLDDRGSRDSVRAGDQAPSAAMSAAGAASGSDAGAALDIDEDDLAERRGAGENGSHDSALTAEMQAEQVVATTQPAQREQVEPAGSDVRAGSAAAVEPTSDHNSSRAAASSRAAPIATKRAMTIAEKIFASRWVVDAAAGRFGVPWVKPGDTGFVSTDLRFSHEYVSPMAAIFFEQKLGPDARVTDPGSILMFRDHLTYLHQVMPPERVQLGLLDVARQLEVKQREFAAKQGIKLYGERVGLRLGSEAICHSKVLESYAEPGMVIVGTDSHTPHSGAVGCIAFGIGTTAIFNAWITRDVRVSVPPSFRVLVHGEKPEYVTAKDFMLEILRHPYIRDGHAIGQIIEYGGEAVRALSVDERATMTNMAAEVGAFTGIVAPDERAVDYLVEERGMDRARARTLCDGLHSDDGAEYVQTIEIDASAIRPMVALPGDPGNGRTIDELDGEPVRIDVAYAGSCTAGKKEDMDMYAAVLAAARTRGQAVHPDVKLYIQCGSQEVRAYCEESGYLRLFEEVGAEFIEPGCGACIAAGPGTSKTPDEVTISSQNRNFPGRSGPGQLYLASPYTVAASAIAGHITAWRR